MTFSVPICSHVFMAWFACFPYSTSRHTPEYKTMIFNRLENISNDSKMHAAVIGYAVMVSFTYRPSRFGRDRQCDVRL